MAPHRIGIVTFAVVVGLLTVDAKGQTAPAAAGSASQASGEGATSPSVPAFNAARTPTSPAFTLFGLELSSVERPANPADLAIAFSSAAADGATVPEDFAVEASPFWLVGQPTLTWRGDIERTWWQSLARTASFSIATGDIGTDAAPARGLSIGGRASLFSGRLSTESVTALERLEKLLTAEARVGLEMMSEVLKELSRLLLEKKITAEEHSRLMGLLQAATLETSEYMNSAERRAVDEAMEKLATVREGFFLEIAAASGWRFPDAVWGAGTFDRWGVWATPSFVRKNASLIGVLRYLSEDASAGTEEGVLDLGVRAVASRDRYAVSLEYVRRNFQADALEDGHRLVGIAEYAVTDDTWLVASFGRDHDTVREGSLVARLGLSFNFVRDRVVTHDAAR